MTSHEGAEITKSPLFIDESKADQYIERPKEELS